LVEGSLDVRSRAGQGWQGLVAAPWSKRLALAGLIVAAAAVVLWAYGGFNIDDAPITYRYAENIASGSGFVYNTGEHVLGTSTPLYTLILAGLRWAGIPVAASSNALNFLASIAVVVLTLALVERLTGSFAAGLAAGLMLLAQQAFLRFTMSGMETPLYTLLILAALYLVARDRTRAAAVVAALAVLMRLDGLALAGAVLLAAWVTGRRLPWIEALIMALILAPWVIFAFFYFGSPIPQSIMAKQGHLITRNGSRFWIWSHLFGDADGGPNWLLPLMALGAVWAMAGRERRIRWLATLSWLAAYLLAYTVVGIDFYGWYLTPVYPVLAALAAAGLWAALQWLPGRPASTWRGAVMLLLALLLVVPYAVNAHDKVDEWKRYVATVEQTRVRAGDWLRTHVDPASRVAAGAIGHVGYQSGLYIYDTVGLVSTPGDPGKIPLDYRVLEMGTDAAYWGCSPIQDFATGWPGYRAVVIWDCAVPEVAQFGKGAFKLNSARITNLVRRPNGTWRLETSPYLETTWLKSDPQIDRDWTMYVHLTDGEGKVLAQADHVLGKALSGATAGTAEWPTGNVMYDYVALPEELAARGEVEVRVGLWDPNTQDRLPPQAAPEAIDTAGALVLKLRNSSN
jgi:hypothetical protein